MVQEGTPEVVLYSATYDGGSRVSATVGGTTHTYSGSLYDEAGSTAYTPGVSQRQNGSDLYFHGDQLGSTRYLTDSTGANAPTAYRYDAYGVPSFQGGPDSTKYKFGGAQGYQSDAFNGVQLLGARYYDPQVGRFLSPDPIGYGGGLNVYAYCGGDPVNFSDPLGLWATGSYWGDVGQVFVGYGEVLGGLGMGLIQQFDPVHQFHQMVGMANFAIALGGYAGECGGGAALHLVGSMAGNALSQLWSGLTDWTTTDDPRRFGQSFGTFLAVVGSEGASSANGVPIFGKCFAAGTAILTAEGEKPIEQVKAGDKVLTADPETGKQRYGTVTRAFVREADGLVVIRTEDGRTVEATPEHPFWVEGKGFVEAKRLARSDLLRDASGNGVRVESVTPKPGKVRVYNFEVEGTHTYYAAGLWVHNICIPAYVRNAGSFVSWLRSMENPSTQLTSEEVDHLVETARAHGVSVIGSANDLAGHPGTPWNVPHIHFGDARIHIPVPPGYVIP